MGKYFKVSSAYAEDVYCANIAHAESMEDVETEYAHYNWYSITAAMQYDVEEARRTGMPIVDIEPEPTKSTFTIWIGNGYIDSTRNTPQGLRDVAICRKIIGNCCYVRYMGGQMEQVLDDGVSLSFLPDMNSVDNAVIALREAGIMGALSIQIDDAYGKTEEFKIIPAESEPAMAEKWTDEPMTTTEAIALDIRDGLYALGFRGHVELLRIGYNRLAVLVNGSNVGIWDVTRKTFCD